MHNTFSKIRRCCFINKKIWYKLLEFMNLCTFYPIFCNPCLFLLHSFPHFFIFFSTHILQKSLSNHQHISFFSFRKNDFHGCSSDVPTHATGSYAPAISVFIFDRQQHLFSYFMYVFVCYWLKYNVNLCRNVKKSLLEEIRRKNRFPE